MRLVLRAGRQGACAQLNTLQPTPCASARLVLGEWPLCGFFALCRVLGPSRSGQNTQCLGLVFVSGENVCARCVSVFETVCSLSSLALPKREDAHRGQLRCPTRKGNT